MSQLKDKFDLLNLEFDNVIVNHLKKLKELRREYDGEIFALENIDNNFPPEKPADYEGDPMDYDFDDEDDDFSVPTSMTNGL